MSVSDDAAELSPGKSRYNSIASRQFVGADNQFSIQLARRDAVAPGQHGQRAERFGPASNGAKLLSPKFQSATYGALDVCVELIQPPCAVIDQRLRITQHA